MTVIKQKGVSSERYAKNVRKYINGKHALARGGWMSICSLEHC